MRNVSLEEIQENSDAIAAEVRAGNRLTVIQGGKTIGDLVPHEAQQKWASEEERLKAVNEYLAFLKKGINMGGFKITNRDELYDRD